MNKNAVLYIKDISGFEDDIWQTTGDITTRNTWKEVIENFADNMQEIYDWIGEMEDGYPFDRFDQYILGDAINLLRSIDVVLKGDTNAEREIFNNGR